MQQWNTETYNKQKPITMNEELIIAIAIIVVSNIIMGMMCLSIKKRDEMNKRKEAV